MGLFLFLLRKQGALTSHNVTSVIWGKRSHPPLNKKCHSSLYFYSWSQFLLFPLCIFWALAVDTQCLWECLWVSKHSHVSPKGTVSPCVRYFFPPGSPGTFTTTSNLIMSEDEIMCSASSLPEGPVWKSVAKITDKHRRVGPIGQPINICISGLCNLRLASKAELSYQQINSKM